MPCPEKYSSTRSSGFLSVRNSLMAMRTRVSFWLINGVTASKPPIVLSSRTFASAWESAAGVLSCASLGSSYLLLPMISAYFIVSLYGFIEGFDQRFQVLGGSAGGIVFDLGSAPAHLDADLD